MVNLHNYEEWFLLYIDGELNENEISSLHTFLEEHPELKGELEVLQSTILPADNIVGNWDFLKRNEEMDLWKDHILSDLDGELDKEKSIALQLELASNSNLTKFSQELHLTKLSHEKVTFPDKTILLYEENNKKVMPLWFRYAAVAAVLFLIIGISWKINRSTKPEIIVIKNSLPITKSVKSNKNRDSVITRNEVAQTLTQKTEKHNHVSSLDKSISPKERADHKKDENLDEVATRKPIEVDQTITPQLSNAQTQPQTIATINNVVLNNPIKSIETNIGTISKEENNTPRSGKRMILASNLENEDRINVANTSINLSKAFGLFKRNKDKSSSTQYKKIAVANFEVKVKTGQL